MVLIATPAGDTYGTYVFFAFFYWDSTCENHNLAVVRRVNAKKLPSRLAMLSDISRCDSERSRCPRFFDRDIYAPDPCSIHPDMCYQIATRIRDGDVHRLSDLDRFSLGSGYNSTCVI